MPIPPFKFKDLTRTDLLQFDGVNFVNVPVYAVGKNVMWGPEGGEYNSLTVGDVTKNISLVGHKHTTDDIIGLKELINDLGVNSSANIDLSMYLPISTFTNHLNNLNSAKHVTQEHLDKLNNYWHLDDQGNLYTTYNTYSTKGLSAYGLGEDGGSTGGGGVDMLDGWANYTAVKANYYVPASLLVPFRDDTLNRLDSLESGGGTGGTEYILPTASSTTLGGIKVGNGLTINNGVLSADVQSNYSLPTASSTTLGGVKIGTNVTISNGTISVHNPLTLGTANGLSLSNQQLSLSLANTTNNGALSANDKVYINLLREFFEHDIANNAIKALKPFYSVGEVSAYGLSSGGSGGTNISKLSNWTLYTSVMADYYVPASLLVSFRNDALSRLTTLEAGGSGGGSGDVGISITGSGNAVTGVSKSGNTLTFAKSSTFALSTHTHTIANITDLQTALNSKQNTLTAGANITISGNTISSSGGTSSVAWSSITDKPSTFAPSAHTHTIANVTGLQSALNGKSDTGHTHNYLSLTGGTMTGILKAQNNTSYTTKQVRNMILSTGNANSSQMANGDIWIKYE